MVEISRSINPAGHEPGDAASEMVLEATGGNVRELQRKLWVAAKRSPGRRFHALYGHLSRRDVLEEAWKRVKRNKGAAGVDSETLSDIARSTIAKGLGKKSNVEEMLTQLVERIERSTQKPHLVEAWHGNGDARAHTSCSSLL